MPKPKLLLLDANIIIYAHELGIWDALVQQCSLLVAETVVQEADFWYDDSGGRHEIELNPYIQDSQIDVIAVELIAVRAFHRRFRQPYAEKLDDGELESLAYLDAAEQEIHICSADAIVFKVLGCLAKGHLGVSLEEILHCIGYSKSLGLQYRKHFREKYTRIGQQDGITGMGMKPES